MDLVEHAAGVWARKWLVLAIAVLVALGVYGWRSTVPEQYVATTQLQIRLSDAVTGDPASQLEFYSGTASGLTTTRPVVATALEAAGRDDDVEDVTDLVSAEAGEAGFLTIEAAGETPQEAASLADALSAAVVEQVATEQAADLAAQRAAVTTAIAELGRDRNDALDEGVDNFERAALDREREALLGSLRTLAEKSPWRLAVVEPATLPTAPAAPTPLRDALLALILALILAAEGVVIARAVRGSLSARDPAADAAAVAGVPGLLVSADDSAVALTPLLPEVGSARSVTVVQAGDQPHARTAGLLAELFAIRGVDVLLVDANPARPTVHAEYDVPVAPGLSELRRGEGDTGARLARLPRVRTLHVLPAGDDPADGRAGRPLHELAAAAPQARVAVAASIGSVDDLIALGGDLEGTTVLDVDARTTRRRLRRDVDTLRGLGLDVVAVTVSSGRRGTGPRLRAQPVTEPRSEQRGQQQTPGNEQRTGGPQVRTPQPKR